MSWERQNRRAAALLGGNSGFPLGKRGDGAQHGRAEAAVQAL